MAIAIAKSADRAAAILLAGFGTSIISRFREMMEPLSMIPMAWIMTAEYPSNRSP